MVFDLISERLIMIFRPVGAVNWLVADVPLAYTP